MASTVPHPRADERFVKSGEAQLYVRAVGHGLTIVAVHGGPDFDHQYLLPELDRLADNFRLVYYDQRGRGASYDQRSLDVTMASDVADLDVVRRSMAAETVALLGHSWGAVLAMEYATRHPNRVSHLILVNAAPSSHEGAAMARDAVDATRTPEEIEALATCRLDPRFDSGNVAADLDLYRIHFRPAVGNPAHLDALLSRLRAGFRPESILAARAIEARLYEETWESEQYDLLPKLAALELPAMVIHGDRDFIPLQLAHDISAAIPGCELVVLPNCGHFAYLEQPERFRQAVTSFMARHAHPRQTTPRTPQPEDRPM